MYFDLKEDFQSDAFDLAYADEHCIPHANGQPEALALPGHLSSAGTRSAGGGWVVFGWPRYIGKVLELKPSTARRACRRLPYAIRERARSIR